MGGLSAQRELGGRDRQRLETRERLFAAALAEIRENGLAAAQVDRITAAAGVSRGAFYFHFPAKEDVLLEWERRREAEILRRLDRVHGGGAQTLRGVLLAIVGSLGDLATSPDGCLVRDALSIHLRRSPDAGSYLLLAAMERRLAAALQAGELRQDVDARQAAILFLSNVFGFLVTCTTAELPQLPPELLVDVFLSGVTAPRRRVPPRRRGSDR